MGQTARGPVGRGSEGEETPRPTGPLAHLPTLLLYDGNCGFCASSVQWVLRRDRQGTLRFAALQGETAHPILARHPELAGVDSVVWVADAGGAGERVEVRSAAALSAARYLEGGWAVVARLAALIPRGLRDWGYDLVAKHRHTLISDPACLLPTPAERDRFLP